MSTSRLIAEVVVARQPIFDRSLTVIGYELLFRGGAAHGQPVIDSAEQATARVVVNSMTEIGLEELVGDRPAWVNLTRDFLLGGMTHALPAERVMLEIVEDQLVDDQLVARVAELRQQGYRFALDDFDMDTCSDALLGLTDVVKLDVLALGREGLRNMIARLRPYALTLAAEKLETREDYDFAVELGCELFQGYFFCRPELVRGRRIDADRLRLLEVLAALQDASVDLHTLEAIIVRDVGLSYRLLRYINSAFFGLRQPVRSIGQALALLGLESLRRWASLSMFAGIVGKPAELTVTALIRARFCELAGAHLLDRANSAELFTLGLFSVIDALMDIPLGEVLDRIPFPQDMRDALISHDGDKGLLLACITALEVGDVDHAETIIPNVNELYLAALAWANHAQHPLFDEAVPAAA